MNQSFFKRGTAVLTALCFLTLFSATALADAYSIDEALGLVGTEAGRENGGMLELIDDFSQFDVYCEEYFSSEGGKTMILWREAPEKLYTASSAEIDANFVGEDAGKPKVYLCAELMERIPEEMRAKTFDEADHILMAEVIYELSAMVCRADQTNGSDMPSADRLEEILNGEFEFAEDEGACIYYPLFDCTVLTSLYNTRTLGASFIDWRTYPYKDMRAYSGADDYWQAMIMLIDLIQASGIEDEEARYYAFFEVLYANYMEESYLTDDEWNELIDLASGEDMDALAVYCWNKFWEMAPLMAELDPDCADLYEEVIARQSLDGLAYIVNTRGYSVIDMEDADIMASRAYLGQPDLDAMERMLENAVDFMDSYDWDMQQISEAMTVY